MHVICVFGTKKYIIDITDEPEQNLFCAELDASTQYDPMWIPSLNLKKSDKQVLETDDWINDRIIDAVNELAADQMNNSCNFQTTLL